VRERDKPLCRFAELDAKLWVWNRPDSRIREDGRTLPQQDRPGACDWRRSELLTHARGVRGGHGGKH
jgi:hypothetical protein